MLLENIKTRNKQESHKEKNEEKFILNRETILNQRNKLHTKIIRVVIDS